ncbi:MAG: hypothetical protein WBQ23_11445 [Bacteroidota bacterium]
MDRKVFILVMLAILAAPAFSQFREEVGSNRAAAMTEVSDPATMITHPTTNADSTTSGKKLLYLTGAAMGFALFDYIGFNLVRDNDAAMPFYRVLQGAVQLGISWFLYEQVGLPTSIAFNVLWWTWGADAIYYGYTELFNVGGSWRGRGIFQSDIMNNNCYWASWTPVGIAQGMDPDKKIAGNTLVAQSIVGAFLAVSITVGF